jgi:hypothetical protein
MTTTTTGTTIIIIMGAIMTIVITGMIPTAFL